MDYKDLNVWKEALGLVEDVYTVIETMPKTELYGLSGQIKRSCISIPSNIAEGANRQTKKEFIQFLYIALGSTAELETQIVIAQRLGFINNGETICITITKIRKMINALIKSLKTDKL